MSSKLWRFVVIGMNLGFVIWAAHPTTAQHPAAKGQPKDGRGPGGPREEPLLRLLALVPVQQELRLDGRQVTTIQKLVAESRSAANRPAVPPAKDATPEQKTKLERLQGRKFDLSQLDPKGKTGKANE